MIQISRKEKETRKHSSRILTICICRLGISAGVVFTQEMYARGEVCLPRGSLWEEGACPMNKIKKSHNSQKGTFVYETLKSLKKVTELGNLSAVIIHEVTRSVKGFYSHCCTLQHKISSTPFPYLMNSHLALDNVDTTNNNFPDNFFNNKNETINLSNPL